MPTPLEITFHGPFVFRFGREYAWAYAPRCDEHYLNILTDMEDVTLPRSKKTNKPIRTFELAGPIKSTVPTSKTTEQLGENAIITYPWYSGEKGKEKGWPDTQEDWEYVLKFPAPDYIYGLVPEYVWIYGYPTPCTANDGKYYARALRFRYEESACPKFNVLDGKNFHANHLGGTNPSYSIEIRYTHYHSVARKKEEYFADAQSCFESMRENLPPCDQWKVFFGEDPAKSGVQPANNAGLFNIEFAGGPNGPHDCGAAVMALEDGISLKPKTHPRNSRSVSRGRVEK
jgi:hypothetical protein